MAAKPLTSEAIALTEKKMDMTLDEIIKMSKKPITSTTAATTAATAKVNNNRRASNKSQRPFNGPVGQGNSLKLQRFVDSRSSLRQGALAQRRSNFQGALAQRALAQRRSNFQGFQFPIATEAARKAAAAPIRNRPFNHNRLGNWNNKPRVGVVPVQRRAAVGYVAVKKQKQSQQGMMVPKQRPQTLDSLFANMKEQRMRVQQNITRHAGAQQRQHGRGRFGNFRN